MMFKLFFLFIFCLTTFTGCVIPTYFGQSSLNQTQVSKTNTKISSVLIVGAGSTASRLFLESLSAEIIKLFSQQNIQAEFSYVGKIPRHTQVNLKEVIAPKYDSYLVFSPMDTSFVNTHKSVAIVAAPLGGGYGTAGSMIGTQYKEDYNAILFTNNNSLNKVWQSELMVDFDFTTSSRYQKIAKDIFSQLSKNGYISTK